MINISIVKTIDTNGATIFKLDPSVIKIGNQSANLVDTIQFDNIPEEWDGCTVRAVFIPGVSAAVACLLDENHQVEVSAGFTKARGVLVVDAFNASEYHAYTTNCQYTIANHANISNTIDPEYTPTQVEQILSQAQTYANSAIDARDAAQGYAEDAAASAAEIEDMTVSASTLPAGSAATVTKTETQTGINLEFGIPRGADGQVQDVKVNGASVVADGVAEIPIAQENGDYGAVKIGDSWSGLFRNSAGAMAVLAADNNNITNRNTQARPIVPTTLDYAVKAAMTDGRGAAWSAAEQLAGRQRLGFGGNWELLIDDTTSTEDLIIKEFAGCIMVNAQIITPSSGSIASGSPWFCDKDITEWGVGQIVKGYYGAQTLSAVNYWSLTGYQMGGYWFSAWQGPGTNNTVNGGLTFASGGYDRAFVSAVSDYPVVNKFRTPQTFPAGTRIIIRGIKA